MWNSLMWCEEREMLKDVAHYSMSERGLERKQERGRKPRRKR